MVEMTEVSAILRGATRKSLIIYDEVGRGTSTFDGMSIARAIIEYTAGRRIGARTPVCPHYHELTGMEGAYEGIVNYHIAARKRGDTVTFLRKIVRGSTDDSFGIEVAKLAGLPNEVIRRAREILAAVETSSRAVREAVDEADNGRKTAKPDDGALSLDDCLNERLIDELRALDVNTLSPFECMSLLFEWKKADTLRGDSEKTHSAGGGDYLKDHTGQGGSMGNIQVLSFEVANLIAAGEVVDRPASAIKEMMENAIDAGARHITVEIQSGGVSLMRVTDDGCGMSAEDLPMAIRRHATSKIRDAADLDGIITLGFRGEALAAISSVSDMRIMSKRREDDVGSMLEVRGGTLLGVSEFGCGNGTTVIVEHLFANVPARRKFLKRDATEAMAVGANVERVALSHPEIAVRFISDGVLKLDTAGDGQLKSAVYAVYGRDFAARLIPLAGEFEGVEISGFIGRSDNVRANRNGQSFLSTIAMSSPARRRRRWSRRSSRTCLPKSTPCVL